MILGHGRMLPESTFCLPEGYTIITLTKIGHRGCEIGSLPADNFLPQEIFRQYKSHGIIAMRDSGVIDSWQGKLKASGGKIVPHNPGDRMHDSFFQLIPEGNPGRFPVRGGIFRLPTRDEHSVEQDRNLLNDHFFTHRGKLTTLKKLIFGLQPGVPKIPPGTYITVTCRVADTPQDAEFMREESEANELALARRIARSSRAAASASARATPGGRRIKRNRKRRTIKNKRKHRNKKSQITKRSRKNKRSRKTKRKIKRKTK